MTTNEPGPSSTDAGLVRVRLDIAYDGGDFSGWAAQPGRRTVQGVVEDALTTILRQPGRALTVAGRTDAGVHASGQVAHVDVPSQLGASSPVLAAPAQPGCCRPTSASPRRRSRRLRRAVLGPLASLRLPRQRSPGWRRPLRRADTLAWARPLDVAAMAAAARLLLGEHDFAAFCRRREGATSIRTLQLLDVERTARGIEWRCRPTRSATRWCARSSGRSSRSGTAAATRLAGLELACRSAPTTSLSRRRTG